MPFTSARHPGPLGLRGQTQRARLAPSNPLDGMKQARQGLKCVRPATSVLFCPWSAEASLSHTQFVVKAFCESGARGRSGGSYPSVSVDCALVRFADSQSSRGWLPKAGNCKNFSEQFQLVRRRASIAVEKEREGQRRTRRVPALERAHEFQQLLDSGEVENRAQIARRHGISRARVTQTRTSATCRSQNSYATPSECSGQSWLWGRGMPR
jgi:hypothetical protein